MFARFGVDLSRWSCFGEREKGALVGLRGDS